MGAITRSAYFLGVDAIATPSRQSAPWSTIAVKASAGAAEGIPIFTVADASRFLSLSAREGWRIYASDAIPAPVGRHPSIVTPHSAKDHHDNVSSKIVYALSRGSKTTVDQFPVSKHPTILMMGSEDSGLRHSLLSASHYRVGIQAGRKTDEIGVDSLNVSAAASILCQEFLRKPPARRPGVDSLF